jgi:hypothetical protein
MIQNFIKNFFGPKAKDRPAENLETLFYQAMANPAARPAFYEAFRDAELWVSGIERGAGNFDLTFLDWEGEKILPVFSTEERLRAALAQKPSPLKIPARQLYAAVKDKTWALNPWTDLGREIDPLELKELFGRAAG